MTKKRTISIHLIGGTVQITPHWAGKGIAIHKPVRMNKSGEVTFRQIYGYWYLTHIQSGRHLAACMGSLDRAKSFAKAWDEEFAALTLDQTMPREWHQAWEIVKLEMKMEPPRKPRARGGHVPATVED